MVMPTFPVFDRKYIFWANLLQKIKIVNLSWNEELTIMGKIFETISGFHVTYGTTGKVQFLFLWSVLLVLKKNYFGRKTEH